MSLIGGGAGFDLDTSLIGGGVTFGFGLDTSLIGGNSGCFGFARTGTFFRGVFGDAV